MCSTHSYELGIKDLLQFLNTHLFVQGWLNISLGGWVFVYVVTN